MLGSDEASGGLSYELGARARQIRDDLFALACRDDVESRLVVRTGKRWSVHHGPFAPRTLAAMPVGVRG